jgi:hypothetical protein
LAVGATAEMRVPADNERASSKRPSPPNAATPPTPRREVSIWPTAGRPEETTVEFLISFTAENRKGVPSGSLGKESIYNLKIMSEKFEARARQNLEYKVFNLSS